ncbi:hypothetical protein QMK33_04075 [Hymenobacter sp. H14-R3]|uniref:hypothetical protein n=1 Tax=Hymenobacter sp. H14-R3 TaxID=3046308 RepID=UPI0024B890D3|nr:hypothetical protein [Hymenobacter sp. H14-R3]MDJ0364316.1 hypothetical protein [Hymenobacter sp. H14-R3]
MHVVYLVFGPNAANHTQAYFSILTFLRQPAALSGITVVTDRPDFYARLGARVRRLPVSAALLREWEGPHQFFWRVKIKALEAVAAACPGQALLYLDSDTFLGGQATDLTQALAANTALMHESEGELAALPSKTERLMWQQLRGRPWEGISLAGNTLMWNAGAVGIPAGRTTAAIALALRLCDAWCAAGVTRRLIEQLALSVALAETGPLAAASASIGHYWSAKPEWNQPIAAFLLASFLQTRPVEDEVAALAGFDFGAQPVKQRVKATRGRLEGLAERLFPNQQQEFWR